MQQFCEGVSECDPAQTQKLLGLCDVTVMCSGPVQKESKSS